MSCARNLSLFVQVVWLEYWIFAYLPQARRLGNDDLWADFVRMYILWRLTP
jgi:hypothetical protein